MDFDSSRLTRCHQLSAQHQHHSQVGQAITAEATTLAPWAKLGRRASRQDDNNIIFERKVP